MRFGAGPVFASERLTASRRWQYYALRAAGLAALLVAMGMVASSEDALLGGRRSVSEYSDLGRLYFKAIVLVELALVLLAAPATTAGAICLDRSRGALEHLMTTELSDAEIVLGKLGARLLPILGLVACSLPVLALSSLLGGTDAFAQAFAFAVIAAVAMLACTLGLALSLWARRPHEVVLAAYSIWALVLAGPTVWGAMSRSGRWVEPPAWLMLANPFDVALFGITYGDLPDGALAFGLAFIGAVLALSGVLVLAAIRGLRPAVIGGRRGARGPERAGLLARLLHRLPGPSLDGNPVLWREWHRARSPRLSAMLIALVAATVVASAARAVEIWSIGVPYGALWDWGSEGIFPYLVTSLFAAGVLAAVAPMSLSEERRRGSLDVLLTTPLPTRAIVLGKWLSLYRTVPWLAVGPGALGLALAVSPPLLERLGADATGFDRLHAAGLIAATILVHGAAIISLGLGLATWLRRETRAIGVSIAAFVLISEVWPGLCLILTEPHRRHGLYLAMGAALSPIYAVTALVGQLCRPNDWGPAEMEEIAVCTGGVAVAAVLILGATIATFDRRMGRMPERGRPGRHPSQPRRE